jgi:hypothetical protein
MAYLPSGTDSHKDQDIRRVLSRLAAMAEATGCTVLLLRHLNKAKGGDPLYRGGGSIGIVGAARAGMLVAADPDDDAARVLAATKSNLAPEPEALRYQLVDADADAHGVARVQWLGVSTHDARALLAEHSEDSDDEPGGNPAAAFIVDYLMRDDVGGESAAGEVLRAGRAAGFTDNDLKHARSRARRPRIASRKAGMGAGWVWAIDTEGATKVPKVPASQVPAPSAPSVAPSDGPPSGETLPRSGATGGLTAPVTETVAQLDNRGPTGVDQGKRDTSGDAETQSGQSGHHSETRRDRQHDTEQTRPDTGLWLVSGEPVDGDR